MNDTTHQGVRVPTTYKGQVPPYQWGPGASAVLSGTGGTAQAISCLPAPSLGRTSLPMPPVAHGPETAPDSHTSEAAARPLCELRAGASACRARPPSQPKHQRPRRPLAHARSDCCGPNDRWRGCRGSPRRWRSGGLVAAFAPARAQQTGSHVSLEVRARSWSSVRSAK